jgi:hypothetical protein
MMMAEAASPAAGGVIVSTPTAATAMHDDQRTGAAPESNAAATSMMAMMMMAGHGHGHGHGRTPSDPPQPPPPMAHGATGSVLDRSHSHTESMVLEALEDSSSADSYPPRHRLSATLSDVLQSLSKLSTDNGAAGWATTTFEDNYRNVTHSQSMPSSCNAGSRRSSVDASSLALVVPASSFHTPEIQRSVAPLQGPHLHPPPLLHRPPTHKREHSSSSLGYGYANTTTWSCAANLPPPPPYPTYQNHPISSLHPMNSSCQSSGTVGSANKKSRTGSFLLLQSAPHLPLSPELDAAAGLSATDRACRGASAPALGDTSANAASRGGEAGEGPAPMPWKSRVRLPPPLFSPVLPRHPPLGAATLPDLASGCHPGSEHPTPPGGRFLVGPANPVLAVAENVPPSLQPELPVLDEPTAAGEHPADHTAGGGDPGPVVRLQQRRGAPLPSHPLLAHVPFAAGGGGEVLEPAGSGGGAPPLLPPPVPLMSSPAPSPTVGPRRVLRMRKADAMDLALP